MTQREEKAEGFSAEAKPVVTYIEWGPPSDGLTYAEWHWDDERDSAWGFGDGRSSDEESTGIPRSVREVIALSIAPWLATGKEPA